MLRNSVLVKSSGRSYVRQEIAALLCTLCNRAAVQARLPPHGLRAAFITVRAGAGGPTIRKRRRKSQPWLVLLNAG